MTADIPGLLIGVDNDVREIGYKLYKWIGDPNRMQYPNAARFAKIPAEVFTVCKFNFFSFNEFIYHYYFLFF
jgi:hypothetical protein